MNDGLINFLMAKHRLTRERAEMRAKYIIAKQAERAAAKKVRLQQAQGLLPFDGLPDEEATNRFEVDEDLPF